MICITMCSYACSRAESLVKLTNFVHGRLSTLAIVVVQCKLTPYV